MDGRALLAGVDLLDDNLPLDRALNVIEALMVDDAMPAVVVETKRGAIVYDRVRVRSEIADRIDATQRAIGQTIPRRAGAAPDRQTWGLLPEHQAGLGAAMRFVGGLN